MPVFVDVKEAVPVREGVAVVLGVVDAVTVRVLVAVTVKAMVEP